MKTFTKIMLILAGVFGTIGVICMVVAFAMGLTTSTLWDMVENGQFAFDLSDIHISSGEVADSGITIYEDCKNIEIDFDAGSLEIYYDDVENIQIKCKNLPNYEANVEKDTLEIGRKSGVNIEWQDDVDRKLTIILPIDMQFEHVELEVEAGLANISDLVTSKFDLEVGAGQAIVKKLSVQELNVKAGAGEVDIEIVGAEVDYNYDVKCGIGQILVGSHSWEGIAAQKSVTNADAVCHMDIECGVGQVNMHFTCDTENGICDDESHNHNGHNSNNHH